MSGVDIALIAMAAATTAYSVSEQQKHSLAAEDRQRLAEGKQKNLMDEAKRKEDAQKKNAANKIMAQRSRAIGGFEGASPMSAPVLGSTSLTSFAQNTPLPGGKTLIGQ